MRLHHHFPRACATVPKHHQTHWGVSVLMAGCSRLTLPAPDWVCIDAQRPTLPTLSPRQGEGTHERSNASTQTLSGTVTAAQLRQATRVTVSQHPGRHFEAARPHTDWCSTKTKDCTSATRHPQGSSVANFARELPRQCTPWPVGIPKLRGRLLSEVMWCNGTL